VSKLHRNPVVFVVLFSWLLFVYLNFYIESTTVFGLDQYLLHTTGYFFGVGLYTADYFLIAMIPVLGFLLIGKKKDNLGFSFVKNTLILATCCGIALVIGLILLTTDLGSASNNPLLPNGLRVEPFKMYSTICIGIGIWVPFLLMKRK
jgi:hypothetical protein